MKFLSQFLGEYGLFLLETLTLVAAILIVVLGITAILNRNKQQDDKLTIKKINKKYEDISEQLRSEILDKKAFNNFKQTQKKEQKNANKKKPATTSEIEKRRIFVLNFVGDKYATTVENLREEISAILMVATPRDEVVVKLESPGGIVYGYGLGASQLRRIKDKKIRLTVCIDKVAASGGYLMACVADHILAAPFAFIGSIGVLAQLPNVHRLLKKYNIDYEMLTSGEYKRTISMFGENTDKGRKKCIEELEEIHHSFKQHIAEYRPQVDIDAISTGEHWLAKKAMELRLVDSLITSDDYLMRSCIDNDVFEVSCEKKQKLTDKLSKPFFNGMSRLFETMISFRTPS